MILNFINSEYKFNNNNKMKKVNYRTTRSELANMVMPEETKRYKPVSHEQLIEVTLNSIQSAGFTLDKEWYEASSDRMIATGRYTISNIADKEMQLTIGWQNSLNKMISLKFALGTHIMICSNGCVSGDQGAFKRKHTGDVQDFTPKTIEEYIRTAGDVFEQMQKQRETMKEIILSKRVQAELVGRMYLEEEFIESVQLNILKRELSKPTFDYGAPNSLWELYQFTTYALRSTPPQSWMKNHIAANTFFVRESGLIIPETTEIVVVEEAPNQVSMYEVPGFVEEPQAPRGPIEINTPCEEDDEPVSHVSQVDYTEFPHFEAAVEEVHPRSISDVHDDNDSDLR